MLAGFMQPDVECTPARFSLLWLCLSPVSAKGNRFSYWYISPPDWFSFKSRTGVGAASNGHRPDPLQLPRNIGLLIKAVLMFEDVQQLQDWFYWDSDRERIQSLAIKALLNAFMLEEAENRTGMQPLVSPRAKRVAAVKTDRTCSWLHLGLPVAFRRFKRLNSVRLLVLHTELISLCSNGVLYHRGFAIVR